MAVTNFLSESIPVDTAPMSDHWHVDTDHTNNNSTLHHHQQDEEYFDFYDILNQSAVSSPVASVASSNQTGSRLDTRDEDLARIEIAVQAVIFALAVLGNSLVLIALRYRKKKTSRMHLYILHLCVADLLVAFCNILPQLAWDITFRFQGNDFLCRLVKYLQVMVMYLSTYILVATAVDRYRSICHPLSVYNWRARHTHLPIAIVWFLSMLLAIPQVFIFQKRRMHGTEVLECWASFHPPWTLWAYVTTFFLSVYILPFLILAALYGRICYEVCKNFSFEKKFPLVGYKSNSGDIIYKFNGTGHISVIGNSRSGSSSSTPMSSVMRDSRRHSGHRVISRAKLKTVKLTFVVVIAYLLCWSPFMITQMWWAYDEDAPYNTGTFVICLLLASLNSCVNPWIYMAFSGNLLKQIFPCCRNRCPKPRIRLRKRVRSVEDIRGGQQPHHHHHTKHLSNNNHKHNNRGGHGADATTEEKLLLNNNGKCFSSARNRLSSIRNTLFTRSQSTKATRTTAGNTTSDTFRYRIRRGSGDKELGGGGHMVGGATVQQNKSPENGLRVNRVTANHTGAANNYHFAEYAINHHNGTRSKYMTSPYFYQKPARRMLTEDIKHTSV